MYEEIHHPNLLKEIPMVLIRPLPAIYYFSRYVDQHIPGKIRNIFVESVNYLSNALKVVDDCINNQEFATLAQKITMLKNAPVDKILGNLEIITVTFSELCKKYKPQIRENMNTMRSTLVEMYKKQVDSLSVVIMNNSNDLEKVEKLAKTLQNFCHYKVDIINPSDATHSKKLIKADFVIFASTHPPQIHEQVGSLKTYKKPGLAVVHLEKDGQLDKQAIRHGAQLMRVAFPVLFKVFTPIRLYTSVDKNYMKYHLQN